MTKISTVLCTLNESRNLKKIFSNIDFLLTKNLEVVVVDGGSTDGTFEELHDYSDNIIIKRLEKKGLLSQRLEGIKACKNEIIFLYNADDILINIDFDNLINELKNMNVDGLQLRCIAPSNGNFWERSWTEYFKICSPIGHKLKVLGRPALTYRNFFEHVSFPKEKIFNEDTYLSFEQERLYGKLDYRTSEQSLTRYVPKSFYDNKLQFKRYGESDAAVADTLKKFFDLLYHSFIRVAIIRSLILIFNMKPKYAVFTFLHGFIRGYALLNGKISWK
jgi:glycosyltransferase involved in cell wall biosynthesis